jgi:hypothetical protein
VSATIRVDGVKETIANLRKLDPELRKNFNANVKQITAPIVQGAQATYRAANFPSGTAHKWEQKGRQIFPLDTSKAVRGVSTKISTSRRQASTIVVAQTNPGAAVFEFASNGRLGTAFTGKNGSSPRAMWPAADRNQTKVASELAKLVDDVSDRMNRMLL